MYRIDYEINGNRLYIDARDFLTLLVGIPSLDLVDDDGINLIKEIVSSLIITSEEVETPCLTIDDEQIKDIFGKLKKDIKAKEKANRKKKDKLSSDNTIE